MESAPHPQQILHLDVGCDMEPYDILRRREDSDDSDLIYGED